MSNYILTINEKLELMEAYLKLKVQERDWHGVADAAMDLRELEAIISIRAASSCATNAQ